MQTVEIVMSVLVGVGLAAACGYRVFVPLLTLSIASASGFVEPSTGWEWVGSPTAIVALSIASILEIGAYYIPAVDNALDAVALPLATLAGILATASVITDMDPMLRWSVAVIGGGGIALSVQAATTSIRAASTPLTAGMGNWLVSTAELVMSLLSAIGAILMPIVAVIASVGMLFLFVAMLMRFRRRRPQPNNFEKISK